MCHLCPVVAGMAASDCLSLISTHSVHQPHNLGDVPVLLDDSLHLDQGDGAFVDVVLEARGCVSYIPGCSLPASNACMSQCCVLVRACLDMPTFNESVTWVGVQGALCTKVCSHSSSHSRPCIAQPVLLQAR